MCGRNVGRNIDSLSDQASREDTVDVVVVVNDSWDAARGFRTAVTRVTSAYRLKIDWSRSFVETPGTTGALATNKVVPRFVVVVVVSSPVPSVAALPWCSRTKKNVSSVSPSLSSSVPSPRRTSWGWRGSRSRTGRYPLIRGTGDDEDDAGIGSCELRLMQLSTEQTTTLLGWIFEATRTPLRYWQEHVFRDEKRMVVVVVINIYIYVFRYVLLLL
mmetsp:Transcript_21140/g.47771  ORF Transcript_21140/g.47771 Transcript_21140/m.47771 type:complete len:216 (-) Transcript_21140:65-712(-)